MLPDAGDKFFVPAMFSLGRAYESGLGTAPDLTEAVRWYRLAAAQDFAPAAERLYTLGADTGDLVATEETGFGRERGAPF